MTQSNSKTPRKKFLWWGAALAGSLAVWKFLPGKKKIGINPDTAKMLTQDGKLVEIDKRLLAQGGKKITTKELQSWVNKKTTNHTDHGK